MTSAYYELLDPVSPFVCSTPCDLAQEREYVSSHIFPLLDELCRSRGSYFSPKDFQWSPEDPKTKEGHLLKFHLDAIKKCAPYFIGILGETYGPHRDEMSPLVPKSNICQMPPSTENANWLDKNFILAGHGGHHWVLDEAHQTSSIVELEVTQAILLSGDNQCSTLYYRQLEHLEDKLGLLTNNASEEDKNRIVAIHSPESEYAKMKIRDLKQRLVNRGISVKYFKTIEELGQMVLEDWTEIIDMILPPLLYDVVSLDSLHYSEWLAQESFCENCTQNYVSTNEIEELLQDLSEFALSCTKAKCGLEADNLIQLKRVEGQNDYSFTLTAWMKKKAAPVSSSPSILLLVGDRGIGKSALVARWMKTFKEEYPHVFILTHFVSASHSSSNICNFMYQCIQKLRRHFLLTDDYDRNLMGMDMERDATSIFSSFSALCQAFVAALSLGACVILIDGLNELGSCSGLSSQEVKEHEPNANVLMGGEQKVRHLGSLRVMQTALGAKAISCEIVRPQVYRNISYFMEQWMEIWNLRNFWIRSLQNWVKSYSWLPENASSEDYFTCNNFDYAGWLTDSLCFIALSRNGLTQKQILSILSSFGYEGEAEVTEYDWHQLRLSAGATLLEKGDGRIVFQHKYIQEIAEYLLFKSLSPVANDPAAIHKACDNKIRQSYHAHLARYFGQQSLSIQVLEELPWHLMLCGDIFGLLDFLTDSGALLKMLDQQDAELWTHDLKFYWSYCKLNGHRADIIYLNMMQSLGIVDEIDLQMFEDNQGDTFSNWTPGPRVVISTPQDFTWNLEMGRNQQNEGEEVNSEHSQREKDLNKEPNDDALNNSFMEEIFITQPVKDHKVVNKLSGHQNFPGVIKLGWHIGLWLKRMSYLEPCKLLLTSLIKFINRNYPLTLSQHILLARCHYRVGTIHETNGHISAAETDFHLALQTLMSADDMDDEMAHQKDIAYLKGVLLLCIGKIQLNKGDLFEAEELLKAALECIEDNQNCYVLRADIHRYLGWIRSAQKDFPKAEACLCECIQLLSQWVGHFHPLVAEVYVGLARIVGSRLNIRSFNLGQADALYREALIVRENFFGPCDPSVAEILFELGELLAGENSQSIIMEAQKLLRRALDIRVTEFGASHPQTAATQQTLTRLDVALKLGDYEHGSVRSSGRRHNNTLFSAMSFRESDLSHLQSDSGCIPSHRYSQLMNVKPVSRTEVLRHNRPDSMMSFASDGLLSAAVRQQPRLLKRHAVSQRNRLDMTRTTVMNEDYQEAEDSVDQDIVTVESLDSKGRKMVASTSNNEGSNSNACDSGKELKGSAIYNDDDDSFIPGVSYIDSYADVALDLDVNHRRSQSGRKNIVKLRPSSAPRRLFQKFQGTKLRTAKKPVSAKKTERSESSRSHPWSGKSNFTVESSSAMSGHQSHCTIPGRHDINQSTTFTIAGPHSELHSLLGEAPCPRPQSGNIHHKSAWYHVPGRYNTAQQYYPNKRMQKTENAKDIEAFVALKTQWATKRKLYDEQRKQQMEMTERLLGSQRDAKSNMRQSLSNLNSFTRRSKTPVHRKKETPRLMISGLDMMPEPRHGDELVSLKQRHGHGVNFKEPITVG